MKSLAGSLPDRVLINCHFNSSLPTETAQQYKDGKGSSKEVQKLKSVRVHFAYGSDRWSFFVKYS